MPKELSPKTASAMRIFDFLPAIFSFAEQVVETKARALDCSNDFVIRCCNG